MNATQKDPKSDLAHGCVSRQVKQRLEEEQVWSEGSPLGHGEEGAAKRELCLCTPALLPA